MLRLQVYYSENNSVQNVPAESGQLTVIKGQQSKTWYVNQLISLKTLNCWDQMCTLNNSVVTTRLQLKRIL